jgi:Tol biopolymer transport system component
VAPAGIIATSSGGSADFTQLRLVSREGRQVSTIGQPGVYTSPAVSPNGRSIAYSRFDGEHAETDIYVIDLDRQIPVRMTEGATYGFPLWSPDGTQIAFSTRVGSMIRTKRATPSSPEEVFARFANFPNPQAWVPGSDAILFMAQQPATSVDILSATRGAEPVPLLNTKADERQVHVSTDGRTLAYISNASGGWQVQISPMSDPAHRVQVTSEGGYQPRWRRDGRALFYLRGDGTLMEVAVNRSTLDVGAPVPLFQTGLSASNVFNIRNEYDALPDGRQFIVNAPVSAARADTLSVIVNWTFPRER